MYSRHRVAGYSIDHVIKFLFFLLVPVVILDIMISCFVIFSMRSQSIQSLQDTTSLYLARLFKKQTQTSIINYITTYRLEKAKELLLNPDIPVGTVALKVGYGNYSYFSKLFKDVVGCTPNEYRKK